MNRLLLKVAILSMSILAFASTDVAPAIANIANEFKDVSPKTIMLIVTLPAICQVVINLFFGKLAMMFSRRTLFNIGMAVFLIGGIGPAFLNDLAAIFVMRGILGLGLGVLVPLGTVLIADFFVGPEKNTIMGLQSVFVNIGGIIFPVLGGFLCVINWHYTFFGYLAGFLIFLLVFFYMPEPVRGQSSMDKGRVAEKAPLGTKVYFLQGIIFTYSLLLYIFFTNIAIEVVSENIGTAANAGMAMTMFTLGGMMIGFIFGKIIDMIGIFTLPIGWIVTGVGMAVISITHDLNIILVGALLAGIGFTVSAPTVFVLVTNVAPPPEIAFAVALTYGLGGIGQFMSPLLTEVIIVQFGQVPGRFPIFFSSVAFIIIGVLLLLLIRTQFLNLIGETSNRSINKPA